MKKNPKTSWAGVISAAFGLLALLYPSKKEIFGGASVLGIALLGVLSQDAGKE